MADRNGQQRGPHEIDFLLFSNTKMNEPKTEKVDEKINLKLKFPKRVTVL